MDERIKEMIQERLDSEGLTADSWREGDDGLEAVLGRWRVSEDEAGSMGMLFEGDEGELTACVVGAEQYKNERVMFHFTPDDQDGGDEITYLGVLEPVDE